MDIIDKFGRLHSAIHGDAIGNLSRILKTVEEMLCDRDFATIRRDPDPLAAITGSRPVVRASAGSDEIVVYIHNEERVGVKWARTVLETHERDGIKIIAISQQGPSPFTKREREGKHIQFLLARAMCVNVTRHALVPKHERVEVLPDNVLPESLPYIYESDPVVQYYAWPVDTLVRITRHFGGTEPILYFRRVLADCKS